MDTQQSLIENPAPEISVVIPVYKEQDSIKPFLDRMEKTLAALNITHEILFCLDPSPDRTESVIEQEIRRNPNIKLIVFSRRFGQPAATMAGILNCTGKTCVVIDVDLQDPPELIADMYRKLMEGFEVVYAKRRSRKGETVVKNVIDKIGYYVINRLGEVEIPRDTGDFRIMTRRVIGELARLSECHGFLRGLVAHVGFKQAFVEYDRDERKFGNRHYNALLGSWKIGINGIVSFSSRPLLLISIAGVLLCLVSSFLFCIGLFEKIFRITPLLGITWTSLIVIFFSGVQLLSLGLIGEYIGRIYDEVKRRPMYVIDRRVNL